MTISSIAAECESVPSLTLRIRAICVMESTSGAVIVVVRELGLSKTTPASDGFWSHWKVRVSAWSGSVADPVMVACAPLARTRLEPASAVGGVLAESAIVMVIWSVAVAVPSETVSVKVMGISAETLGAVKVAFGESASFRTRPGWLCVHR